MPRVTQRGSKSAGRNARAGTILARTMKARRMTKLDVCAQLRVSERMLHNYMTRKYPLPPLKLAALCDYLDLDPEYLVDARGFLKESRS